MGGETYTNVVLKYNILQDTWDIRQYPTHHRAYTKYVDSLDAVYTVFGDTDGNVLFYNVGDDDNGTPIYYTVEPQDLTFEFRVFEKSIPRIGFVTKNSKDAIVLWRNSDRPEEWETLGTIKKNAELFQGDWRAVKYNFKLSGNTNSGKATLEAIEFPAGITVYD